MEKTLHNGLNDKEFRDLKDSYFDWWTDLFHNVSRDFGFVRECDSNTAITYLEDTFRRFSNLPTRCKDASIDELLYLYVYSRTLFSIYFRKPCVFEPLERFLPATANVNATGIDFGGDP